MLICILAKSFPQRSETFIREHVAGMRSRGHDVVIISEGPGHGISPKEIKEIDATGIRRVEIGEFGNTPLSKIYRMGSITLRCPSMAKHVTPKQAWTRRELFQANAYRRAISQIRPDVIHVHYGIIAAPLHHLGSPKPMLVTWHGYDANEKPLSRSESMYVPLFKERHQHTVGSQFMRRRLLSLGCHAEQVSVIPMGIDTELFSFIDRRSRGPGPLKIVSVGRLDEVKGHRYLIKSVLELLQSGCDLSLTIIGDGPLRDELKSLLNGCNVIHLLGAKPTDKIISELQNADIFALTGVAARSGIEGQGVVYAEAQATGLPVIASDAGGVAESIEHGRSGILCPPGDINAIKSAICYFLDNPSARFSFGIAGRQLVESRFSCSAMLDSFEVLYRNATAGNGISSYP